MTKCGTFEMPDDEYKTLSELYDGVNKTVSITFEEFCGKMIIEGMNSFSKKIM